MKKMDDYPPSQCSLHGKYFHLSLRSQEVKL